MLKQLSWSRASVLLLAFVKHNLVPLHLSLGKALTWCLMEQLCSTVVFLQRDFHVCGMNEGMNEGMHRLLLYPCSLSIQGCYFWLDVPIYNTQEKDELEQWVRKISITDITGSAVRHWKWTSLTWAVFCLLGVNAHHQQVHFVYLLHSYIITKSTT